ncbi:beta-mannosidase [Nocardia sp. NPDC057353]|uniref:beta-mannosidase n=1 Tax=Nocardia sp. NPDC057353 TaxID=3346104 RepID=UPI003645584F
MARVGVQQGELRLDGEPWWPAGLNAYQLATNWSINRGCGAQVDLDAYFAALHPDSLTRFNAFESLATHKVTGARDWAPIDAVFAAAERHGQLLIPVLTAQDGACEDEQFKQYNWYTDGWRGPFAAWTAAATARWHGSPALAAWELVGEPEPGVCPDGDCAWNARTCPPDAAAVLRAFMDEAGAIVRANSPDTPITAGLLGGGQCGSAGDEYGFIAESPYVDIMQYHDYGADGVPLPGDQWNGLARRIEQARAAGKPLLVAEIGQHSDQSPASLAQRAADIERKIDGQRAAGTAGALLWAFVPDPRPGEQTYDIGPSDPLFTLLAG